MKSRPPVGRFRESPLNLGRLGPPGRGTAPTTAAWSQPPETSWPGPVWPRLPVAAKAPERSRAGAGDLLRRGAAGVAVGQAVTLSIGGLAPRALHAHAVVADHHEPQVARGNRGPRLRVQDAADRSRDRVGRNLTQGPVQDVRVDRSALVVPRDRDLAAVGSDPIGEERSGRNRWRTR